MTALPLSKAECDALWSAWSKADLLLTDLADDHPPSCVCRLWRALELMIPICDILQDIEDRTPITNDQPKEN